MAEYLLGLRGSLYKRAISIDNVGATFKYYDERNVKCYLPEYKGINILNLAQSLVGFSSCNVCTKTVDLVCHNLYKLGSCDNVIPIVDNELYTTRLIQDNVLYNCLFIKCFNGKYICEVFSQLEVNMLIRILNTHINNNL